jgi:hypothetical protein
VCLRDEENYEKFRPSDLTVYERIRIEIFSPYVKVAEVLSIIQADTGVGGILNI